jgi:NAD(P)-dependent dehydrogenase (short-subunit alcohol dehydrogenase family)
MKKKILFVGASGAVANKIIPTLSLDNEIIGISKKNKDLEKYCKKFYTHNLLSGSKLFFESFFKQNEIDIIIWNPVVYFPKKIIESSREILHTEFDVAVALPLECLQIAIKNNFKGNKRFIMISSLLAFGYKESWASYSIVKSSQISIMNSFSKEIDSKNIIFKTIAFGAVPTITEKTMQKVFNLALGDGEGVKNIYKVNFEDIAID